MVTFPIFESTRSFKGSVSSISRDRMSILAVADKCIKAHRDTLGALCSMKLRLTANTDKINMDRNFIVSKGARGGMQKFYYRRWTLYCQANFEIV